MAEKETIIRWEGDSPPIQGEEHYANDKPGQAVRHSRSVVRKPGRPRKPRKRGGPISMGRYPFMALLYDYLAVRRVTWSPITYEERERKLRYLCRVFRDLKQQGRTDTMNPTKFTEREIYAFEGWMQEKIHGKKEKKALDPATKCKYRGLINDFLIWNENYAYDRLIRKGEINTQRPAKEIETISYKEFQSLLNHTSQNNETWSDHVAYFIIAMYGYLGLRTKELRLADLKDLDLDRWTFTVAHPKGEGRYGKKRTIPIVEPLRPIILGYLTARREYLQANNIESTPQLIPSITRYRGELRIGHYSGNRLRVIAREVGKETGIPFHIKTLRASCGQMLKDMGAGIETVSKFLGHSSTETTERFYARLRDEAMFRDINALFPPGGEGANSHLIEKQKQISGYA